MSLRYAALLERVRRRRGEILRQFSPDRLRGCEPEHVKNVLVVDSASRSGSSLLYFLLSLHPDVISLNGEDSLFERLHGVGAVDTAKDSDFIPEGSVPEEAIAQIAKDLLSDAGRLRGRSDGPLPRADFASDSARRLLVQYPEIDFDPASLYAACANALAKRADDGRELEVFAYWRDVLEAVRALKLPVDPRHYDLQSAEAGRPNGDTAPPFASFVLEEPPFVVPRPRILPPPAELASKTLVMKSPAHCYRMWLVKKMFPNAKFRFVILARNPAGTINSLMDGWLSGGFFSHNVGHVSPLDIKGYSGADSPWTRSWWKFDLPPGWAEARERPLQDVCAMQWLGANTHVWADVDSKRVDDPIVVHYESFLQPASFAKELGRISEFAGLKPFALMSAPPAVMAVTPPRAGKWTRRKELLAPILSSQPVTDMARRMGYEPRDWENWP